MNRYLPFLCLCRKRKRWNFNRILVYSAIDAESKLDYNLVVICENKDHSFDLYSSYITESLGKRGYYGRKQTMEETASRNRG